MKESFLQTYTRTALKADFKSNDSVPILRTPVVNIFGGEIKEIDKMSPFARAMEHGWYILAGLIVGLVSLIGLFLLPQGETYHKLGIVGSAIFIFIWIFSIIQFTSLLGYMRFRLRRK